MAQTHVTVLFGEEEVRKYDEGNSIKNLSSNINKYTFNSTSEAEAFKLGLKEALGWQDYTLVDTANS